MVAALRRLFGEHAAQIDKANEEVFRRLDRGVPQLVAVRPAAEVIPALAEGRTILHPGPPIEIDRVCDPLRRSMRATIVSEGWPTMPRRRTRCWSRVRCSWPRPT